MIYLLQTGIVIRKYHICVLPRGLRFAGTKNLSGFFKPLGLNNSATGKILFPDPFLGSSPLGSIKN